MYYNSHRLPFILREKNKTNVFIMYILSITIPLRISSDTHHWQQRYQGRETVMKGHDLAGMLSARARNPFIFSKNAENDKLS